MKPRAADRDGGDWCLVAPLVFKTSVGRENVLGGFDSHSPPPFFPGNLQGVTSLQNNVSKPQRSWGGIAATKMKNDKYTIYNVKTIRRVATTESSRWMAECRSNTVIRHPPRSARWLPPADRLKETYCGKVRAMI